MAYLENSLARFYKSADDAARVLLDAGLSPADVDLSGSAKTLWFRALAHAKSHDKIGAILNRAAEEYPGQREALFAALPEFEKRWEEGGGTAPVGAYSRPATLGSVSVVGICFLAFLGYSLWSRTSDGRTMAVILQSLDDQQKRSFDVAKLIGRLENNGEQINQQMKEKSGQIEYLKTVTDSMQRDLAALRRKQHKGSLTVAQRELTARAEAAIAINLAYMSAAQGKLDKALREFKDAGSKLQNLGNSKEDQAVVALISHNAGVVGEVLKSPEPRRKDSVKQVTVHTDVKKPAQVATATEKPALPTPETNPPGSTVSPLVAEDVIRFEPSVLPLLRVEPFDMSGEIESLLLLKPGESLGKKLELPGHNSGVDPGKYNIVCNTKSREQFRLVSDVEVRPAQKTTVRPQALMGKVRIEKLTRPGFPKLKCAQWVPAGEIESGMIHGSPRKTTKWGDTMTIVRGTYDVLVTPEEGRDFVLVKNLAVVAGGLSEVKTDTEIAAIVVRPEATKDLEVKKIYVFKSGSPYYIQETSTAGQAIPVYAGDTYDVKLQQSNSDATLKEKVIPLRGELTLVP